MINRYSFIMLLLAAASFAVSGCKDDSEDDYLAWLASEEETQSDDDAGDDGDTSDGDSEESTGDSEESTDSDDTDDDGVLVINEICGQQDPDDDWVELYNGSSTAYDLTGAQILKTDEDGKEKYIYAFPDGTTLDAKSYLVIATLTGELTSGISNKKQVGIALVLEDGTVVDAFDRDADLGEDATHPTDGSYARIPNGTGPWTVCEQHTRGAAND